MKTTQSENFSTLASAGSEGSRWERQNSGSSHTRLWEHFGGLQDQDQEGVAHTRGCGNILAEGGLQGNARKKTFFFYVRYDICHKHHKQCLCKIIIHRVKVHFVDVF